jgi:long-subunit acyl-CoA synthetase (AMP-forming)
MCMVYGKTGGKWPIVLVCPSRAAVKALAAELAINDPHAADVAKTLLEESESTESAKNNDDGDSKFEMVVPEVASGGVKEDGGDFLNLLYSHPEIKKRVLQDLHGLCREKKLANFEYPQRLVLCSETWTPENELLTAALKMKRIQIASANRDEIEAAYSS